MIDRLAAGSLDVALPAVANARDEERVDFSQPYFVSSLGIARRRTQSLWTILGGLFSTRFAWITASLAVMLLVVGTVAGSPAAEELAAERVAFREYESATAGMTAVDSSVIDALVLDAARPALSLRDRDADAVTDASAAVPATVAARVFRAEGVTWIVVGQRTLDAPSANRVRLRALSALP